MNNLKIPLFYESRKFWLRLSKCVQYIIVHTVVVSFIQLSLKKLDLSRDSYLFRINFISLP